MDRIQTDIRTALAAPGQRWTRARESVLGFLEEEKMPVSAKDVHKKVRGSGINLASVYRCFDYFLKSGVISCVDSPDGVRRFELSDRYRPHHHHVVCMECGEIRDISGCGVKGIEERASLLTGFKILTHQLNLVGLCPQCAE